MTEREIKLSLPGRFTIPQLFSNGTALAQEAMPELDLRATYFDTLDLRLARHGVTLRYRTGDAGGPRWTLKLPVASSGPSTLVRDELQFDAPRREPPSEARALVTAYARREPLIAVATLRTKRRRWRFTDGETQVVELANDEVSVVEGRRIVSRFRELEVEALADDAPLESLADQLRRAGATDAEPIPKVVRALGSRATAAPDISAVPMPADPTVADALAASIADALLRLLKNDPLTRLGDAEGLHQLRVSLRRLRSDLRTLEDMVDPAWMARVEPGLRKVADALGEARDLDVLVERLAQGDDAPSAALAPLFAALETRRAKARGDALSSLYEPPYAGLLDELVSAASDPPVVAVAAAPAVTSLPPLVLDTWDRLERRAEDLSAASSEADFHRTRIAAKRARYAAELTAHVLTGSRAAGARRLAARLADVQDQLGTLQDAAVAEATMRAALSGRLDTEYAFEIGRMVERQRTLAADARDAFADTWKDLRRRRWRKWATS